MKLFTVVKNVLNDDDSLTETREIVSADNIGQVFDSLRTELADESLEVIGVYQSGTVAQQFQGQPS